MDATFLAGPDNDVFVVTVFLSALLFAAAALPLAALRDYLPGSRWRAGAVALVIAAFAGALWPFAPAVLESVAGFMFRTLESPFSWAVTLGEVKSLLFAPVFGAVIAGFTLLRADAERWTELRLTNGRAR